MADNDGWEDIGWEDVSPPKTSLGEDFKIGLANVGNTVDSAWSGLAGSLASVFSKEDADKIYRELQSRKESRQQFANPENKKQTFGGKLASAVSTLPSQVLAMPLSPFETSQTMVDSGESTSRAIAGAGIDTAGNMVGLALPGGIGKTLLAKGLSGAGINAAQDFATKAAISAISEKEKTKQVLGPSWESAALSGVLGAGVGLASGSKTKKKAISSPELNKVDKLGLDVVERPWEQMELPLENSVQQIAERRAAEVGQQDLFGPINEGQLRIPEASPEQVRSPIPVEQQGELPFKTSVEEIATRQNEGLSQRDMFVDQETAMRANDPVRQKLAFEQQQNIEALKQDAIKRLETEQAYKQKALEDSVNDLRVKFGKRPINAPGRKQNGAVNMEVFDEGFNKIKELANGIRLVMQGGPEGPVIHAMQGDKEVGRLGLTADDWFNPKPESNLQAAWVDTHGAPKTGLAEEMYRFASEQGDIIPSKAQTSAGKEMWQKFEQRGVSQGMRIPRSQRGGFPFASLPESIKKLAGLNKNSPETVKAAGELSMDRKRAATAAIIPGLEPFRPRIDTPEKVIALAPEARDLTPVQKFTATTVKPGIRKVRIASNNPLVNFVGEATSKVFTQAEDFARKYITNKDAIGPLYTKLAPKELVEVHQALMSADKHQKVLTSEQLTRAGFSSKQIEFISKFYEMERVKLDTWNEKLLETGQEPVKERIGHMPGIFTGDYRSMVLDEKGKPVGFVGTDTKWGHNKVVADLKQKYPGYTFTEMKRTRLGGQGPRSDVFSGVNDLLTVLAKNDPRIADVLSAVDQANARAADGLFNANKHALDKKGIWGNEGNKPWQTDSVGAARDFFKAYFRYWEEGMLSHLNMPVEAQIKSLLNNPELNNMPRAKEYVNQYIQHMTGRSVGDVGMALNTLLDTPNKMLGVGPSVTRETVNQLNKRLGQQTMGWFNLSYLATQFLQVFQTAVPEFISVASKVGKGPGDVLSAANKSIQNALTMARETFSGEKVDVPPDVRAMFDYAESRGLLTFSEFEDVGKVTQGKFARKYDKIADFNRQIGEQGTRPLVFFSFVELLKDSPLPKEEVFDTAYNLTQDAMVDYSPRERPLMFQKLGVAGQLAGGLQTFSFSYLDQMAKWVKEAKKGNMAALAAGLAVALTYSGVQGLPFYQEADELMKWTTDKFFGEKKSIGETALSNLPDWARYGGISVATGLNAQSRLSAADVLPNSLGEAITPYAGQIGNIGSAIGELVTNRDSLAARNLAMSVMPSSTRGALENTFATDEQGNYLNKRNEKEYPRTSFDRAARYGNMTSLEEYKNRQGLFEAKTKEKADIDRKIELANKITRGIKVNGPSFAVSTEFAKLKKEYIERKGDPGQLDDIILKAVQDKQKTAKQRAEGIPNEDLSSIYRYKYYNK